MDLSGTLKHEISVPIKSVLRISLALFAVALMTVIIKAIAKQT